MTAQIQLSLDMDDLYRLVDQLPPKDRERLAEYLVGSLHSNRTVSEKLTLIESLTFDIPVVEGASYRREDGYNDDGR